MLQFVKNIFSKLGVDLAIFYTSSSRIIQSLGGLVNVFLIASFMTKDEQGFYYTFASVLAIQIFFELGLGGIITQFVAHEMAYLSITDSGKVEGSQKNLSRLSSLLHFCVKWYALLAIFLFLSLIIFGNLFFVKYGSTNHYVFWQKPWFFIALGGSLNFLVSPWMAVLQGMGKVKEMARLALIQQIFVLVVTWTSLILGAKLFISAINAFTGFFILIILYTRAGFPKMLFSIYKNKITEKINYWHEIFPYQWRIALSWISSYFIFQLFNPLAFAFAGPTVAGQMGMTLTALNSILSLTLSWTSTKIPSWSVLIAKKDYLKLDISFNKVLRDSTIVCISLLTLFIVFIAFIRYFQFRLSDRFLPIFFCLILAIPIPINNIINAWATYLRCHKREPFLIQAVIVGFLCAITMFFSSKFFGIHGIIIGYVSVVVFVSLPISYFIFTNKKEIYKMS
jgi:O-antigen/teichoic acid export membrane protein